MLSTENIDEAVETESEWETVGGSGSRFDPRVMAGSDLHFIIIYFVETN